MIVSLKMVIVVVYITKKDDTVHKMNNNVYH